MKKATAILLVIVCLFGMMNISAFAADAGSAGVYALEVTNGYSLTVKKADNSTLTATPTTIKGSPAQLYEGAERFTLSYPNASGYQLVLMLNGTSSTPTENNIWYIDQASPESNNSVTFGIYPKAMTEGEYTVYISSSSGGGLTKVASFKYYQPYTLGDVNNDTRINSDDALMILQHAVGIRQLSETESLAANVYKDGFINSDDALRILQFAVQLITSF